jgi:hypothetical protein
MMAVDAAGPAPGAGRSLFELKSALVAACAEVDRSWVDLSWISDGEGEAADAEGAAAIHVALIPPCGITGGKVTRGVVEGQKQAICVDWINAVIPHSESARSQVIELLDRIYGPGEDLDHGFHTYKQVRRYETGAVIAWSEGRAEFLVSFNGDSCEFFDLERLREFLRWLYDDCGGKLSRLDLAFDDYTRELLKLENVHAAADLGNFCGFRVHKSDREMTRRGELLSDAHTFGRKGKMGSGRQVIFYDKALESDGEINAIRMESRFSKETAEVLGMCLASKRTVESFEAQIRSAIGGSIDFRDRQQKHRHISRMERLGWWSQVLDVLGESRIVCHKTAPPLQQSLEYLRDTWAGNVALMYEIAESQGQDGDAIISALVSHMVDAGKRKITNGWRPGARSLDLDFVELLDPRRRIRSTVMAPGQSQN